MAWYDRFLGRKEEIEVEEKLNPSQQYMGGEIENTREPTTSYERQYEELEIVNRAVNMIVDDAAEIPATVMGSRRINGIIKGIKRAKVETLLNYEPNLFQDINTFKRNLITDFILDGNIFIYFDGVHLYHLPSDKVSIHSSTDSYVEKYTFNNDINYSPSEIIHVKENSFYSIYRGVPRLSPALRTMQLMASMRKFQDNFFKNGAVPGLVLKSPNTLSEKIKEDVTDIPALQPELRDQSQYYTSLVNGGIITINEAREQLGFEKIDGQDEVRVPANIAGSAANPDEGGRPTEEEDDDQE